MGSIQSVQGWTHRSEASLLGKKLQLWTAAADSTPEPQRGPPTTGSVLACPAPITVEASSSRSVSTCVLHRSTCVRPSADRRQCSAPAHSRQFAAECVRGSRSAGKAVGRQGGRGGCWGGAGRAERWLKPMAWGEPWSAGTWCLRPRMPFPGSVLGSLQASAKTTSKGEDRRPVFPIESPSVLTELPPVTRLLV